MAVLWMILYLDLPLLCLKINSGPGLLLLPASVPQSHAANKHTYWTTRLHPSCVRVVILLSLWYLRELAHCLLQGNSLRGIFSQLPPTGPALPCSVCFWQPSHLFWALEIWAVSYFCWKWSLHFCFPFSLLLLDVLQPEKGDMLTAWTTFRPQVPPLHFYTSISSTVKDP